MSQSKFVWAVFNFPGTTEEDLPLTAGEKIEVISRDDEFGDGWWEGVNSSGQQGLFPKIYTSATYPTLTSGAGQASLDSSLDRLDEEGESESSIHQDVVETNGGPDGLHDVLPLPGNISQWSPNDVARHFENLGMEDISANFAEHQINGKALLSMQHTDLREINVTSFGRRFEIMREINMMKGDDHQSPVIPQTDSGASTPPLSVTQRSNARQSTVMPQESATGAVLQESSPSSSAAESSHEYNNGVEPLIPRPSYAIYGSELAPPIQPGDALYKRSDSGLGSSNLRTVSDSTQSSSTSFTPVHRNSNSASSLSFAASGSESLNGRDGPDKGHTRNWSQDTVKTGSHRRGISGTLDSVDETSASVESSDSTPRTPSSTLGSPLSGAGNLGVGPVSPNIGSRPTLLPKRSLLSRRPKWQPNAVSENLEQITAPESAKGADFCGWLRKRGERSYNWKLRYFVLKGTRLAYFRSDRDTSEKGLIDINSHRVLPVDDILFFGPTKHIFKLIPPAPGASRALNFTPPKTHFFCADSKEEMRQWITVFTKATIGRDWSTPVISSCTTKTISLKAARDIRSSARPVSEPLVEDPIRSPNGSTTSPRNTGTSLPLLTPEELVAQQQANKAMRPISGHISRNLSISSASSLRRAVLQAAQDDT